MMGRFDMGEKLRCQQESMGWCAYQCVDTANGVCAGNAEHQRCANMVFFVHSVCIDRGSYGVYAYYQYHVIN